MTTQLPVETDHHYPKLIWLIVRFISFFPRIKNLDTSEAKSSGGIFRFSFMKGNSRTLQKRFRSQYVFDKVFLLDRLSIKDERFYYITSDTLVNLLCPGTSLPYCCDKRSISAGSTIDKRLFPFSRSSTNCVPHIITSWNVANPLGIFSLTLHIPSLFTFTVSPT